MADPRIARIAATLNAAAAAAAARITIKGQLDSIGDDAVAEVAALFPDWTPGVKVAPGDVLAWDGTLVDVLSTAVTVDQGEWGSHTAATPPVVNAGNAGVQTGDVLRVDVDGAGTSVKGLVVTVTVGP